LLSIGVEFRSIEQDADLCCDLNANQYYNRTAIAASPKMIVTSSRNGPVGTVTIAVRAPFTRFRNLRALNQAARPARNDSLDPFASP